MCSLCRCTGSGDGYDYGYSNGYTSKNPALNFKLKEIKIKLKTKIVT